MTMIYNLMVLAYFLSAAAFSIGMFLVWRKKLGLGKVMHLMGNILIAAGMATGIGMMTYSWVMTGEPPFQTLYQSLIFFAVTTAGVHLVASRKIPIMGWASAGFILLILAYAYLKQDGELAQRIPPALQSAWFVPHVVVYFLGYAALFVAFVASILALFYPDPKQLAEGNPLGVAMRDFNLFTYKGICFGFAMISAGLLLGAFWAKFAWGDWWSWDPKENWALITWLIYAAYMHLRFLPGMSNRLLAWFSIIGFVAVMFTYLGVNYLPAAQDALHSYQQN
jgi:cytochrome c-type biogenesis protein CcsB